MKKENATAFPTLVKDFCFLLPPSASIGSILTLFTLFFIIYPFQYSPLNYHDRANIPFMTVFLYPISLFCIPRFLRFFLISFPVYILGDHFRPFYLHRFFGVPLFFPFILIIFPICVAGWVLNEIYVFNPRKLAHKTPATRFGRHPGFHSYFFDSFNAGHYGRDWRGGWALK